jgi:SprT protein
MNVEQVSDVLKNYLPDESVENVVQWIEQYKIKFTIAGNRESIYGDFIPKRSGYRISVNGTLNRYAFLITTVHEIAHLITFKDHQHTVSSHGSDWKKAFNDLMNDFKGKKLFPHDVTVALKRYLQNPSATHCNDPWLMKVLNKYNTVPALHLDDLKEGALFLWKGETFKKGKKLRKRFLCIHLNSRRKYIFSPVAEIERLEVRKVG